MCASLHAGEKTYKLADAQTLRGNIGKQGEILDAISKQIAGIPLNPDIPHAITLQNAIRRSTSNYIKDTLLSLPVLPTLDELQKKKNRSQNHQNTTLQPTRSTVSEVWSPFVTENVKETCEDPLLQQIGNVKGFIEQARNAMKFDEVVSLEANLRELKQVYKQLRRNEMSNENT